MARGYSSFVTLQGGSTLHSILVAGTTEYKVGDVVEGVYQDLIKSAAPPTPHPLPMGPKNDAFADG